MVGIVGTLEFDGVGIDAAWATGAAGTGAGVGTWVGVGATGAWA